MSAFRRGDDCIHCGRRFGASGAIASVPGARRVAFDPGRGRVWRICDDCGEWNLMGSEAAATALPELALRTAHLPATDDADGLALHEADGLTLIRVAPGMTIPESTSARRRKALRRWGDQALLLATAMLAVAAAYLVWDHARGGGGTATTGRFGRSLTTIFNLGTAWALVAVDRRRRLRLPWHGMATWAGLLLTGACVVAVDAGNLLGGFIGALLVPLVLLGESIVPMGWVRLPSGRVVFLTRRVLDFTRLHVGRGATLRVSLPDGTSLDATDGRALLRKLFDALHWEASAGDLAIADESIAGDAPMIRALDRLAPERGRWPDGVPVGAIPMTTRCAIDLALATETGVTGRLTGMRERAMAAGRIADHADALERDR